VVAFFICAVFLIPTGVVYAQPNVIPKVPLPPPLRPTPTPGFHHGLTGPALAIVILLAILMLVGGVLAIRFVFQIGRKKREPLVGIVRSFQSLPPNPLSRREVCDFQFETADSSGNLVFRAVQMRSKSFQGRLQDGHKVEVFGEWRQGTLHASKVHDLTTDAWIIGI
jgi:hypothetical protein